jgi:PIN domain nuclease of toxin-antitoxin system
MEAAYAVRRERLRLDRPFDQWVVEAKRSDGVETLPFEASVAALAGELDWPHGDPMDRGIVATAIAHDAELVTSDERIHKSGLVKVIWK